MRSHRTVATIASLALAALALSACGGTDDDADAPEQGVADEQETGGEPADIEDAATDVDDDTAGDTTGDTTGDTADGPVDVCGLFTGDDFAATFGAPPAAPGEALDAQGSLLGGCSYAGSDGQFVMIQARPASEWDGTVAMYGGAPAAGASMDTSFEAAIGLLAAFDGQPWFAHIMVSQDPGVWDEGISVTVAEAMAAHL